MKYFKDKRVWITGASGGIGWAFAKALNRYGAKLILSARRIEKLQSLKSQLEGDEILLLKLDVTDKDQIDQQSKLAVDEWGGLDILINNAGISQRALVRNTTDDVDVSLLDTNLLGPIRITKKVLPAMLKQGSGQLVIMSSITGKVGTPYRSTYAASKHGLHGFFDSLRAEEEENGISVNILCPGYIHTDISFNALTKDGEKQGVKDKKSVQGMDPDRFVNKALRKIARKRPESIIGGTERIAIFLKRFYPPLLRRVLKKVKP